MKTFIALLLAPAAAFAGTINLGSETCTATKICFNVPNNGGVAVDYISDATQYGRLVISIDGDIYDSGLWTYPKLSAFTLYNAVGNTLSGSLSISVVQEPCVRVGRGLSCPKKVTLNGGKLLTP